MLKILKVLEHPENVGVVQLLHQLNFPLHLRWSQVSLWLRDGLAHPHLLGGDVLHQGDHTILALPQHFQFIIMIRKPSCPSHNEMPLAKLLLLEMGSQKQSLHHLLEFLLLQCPTLIHIKASEQALALRGIQAAERTGLAEVVVALQELVHVNYPIPRQAVKQAIHQRHQILPGGNQAQRVRVRWAHHTPSRDGSLGPSLGLPPHRGLTSS
mmetsp:Transcript_36924/g.84427  ORF Transcript_36924/g.84427 Transcript_36924/m.84427 type:complete len:211 (+) Transcript_36924:331-963(+)